jgi:hypothetical protein
MDVHISGRLLHRQKTLEMTSKTDIIIVNWNSGDQLRQCIESIRHHSINHVGKCIVVDNGSQDGSTDFLKGAPDVDLMLTGENLGFGRACNLGAAQGESEFVLFLNPDASLLPGSLDAPLVFLEEPQNKKVGIVGISLIGDDKEVQRTCARFPSAFSLVLSSFGLNRLVPRLGTHLHEWDHSDSREVPHVIGAFYMIRRDLFERLRGFDEIFCVYLEDLDLSLRARKMGFRSFYLADACAYHKGGGVSEQVKAHRLFYSLRSRIQYAFKHFSWASAVLVTFAALVVEPITRLSLLLLKRRFGEMGGLMSGYRMLWRWVVRTALGSHKTH